MSMFCSPCAIAWRTTSTSGAVGAKRPRRWEGAGAQSVVDDAARARREFGGRIRGSRDSDLRNGKQFAPNREIHRRPRRDLKRDVFWPHPAEKADPALRATFKSSGEGKFFPPRGKRMPLSARERQGEGETARSDVIMRSFPPGQSRES